MAKNSKGFEAANELLLELRSDRDSDDYVEAYPQKLSGPERGEKEVQSLAAKSWPISPQLAARFEFCGHWKNPFPGMEWLSLSEMRKARGKKSYREQMDIREEYWDNSVLQSNPRSHISLFGIDLVDASEVYLVWTDDRVEPRVVWYVAQHFHEFSDLIGYLRYLVPKKRTKRKSAKK